MTERESKNRQAVRITVVAFVVNFLLAVVKLAVGFLSGSAALIADGAHSFSDMITDVILIGSLKIAGKPADREHPYGHGRAETIATLLVALILFGTAGSILINAIHLIQKLVAGGVVHAPGAIALGVALFSILVKEILFRITFAVGKKLNRDSLKANAWHQRSDALSSVAAAVGIGGIMLFGEKWAFLDPAAAIFTAFLIAAAALPIFRNALSEILESSIGVESERLIVETLLAIPALSNPHDLRTRKIGTVVAIEVHVCIDGTMTVFDAHDSVQHGEDELKKIFGEESYILIHMDPKKTTL